MKPVADKFSLYMVTGEGFKNGLTCEARPGWERWYGPKRDVWSAILELQAVVDTDIRRRLRK